MAFFDIIITRHAGLVEYLREIGAVDPDTPVVAHVSAGDIAGKNVVGVLPLSLAACAASVTEVPLSLPRELRGQELTVEQVRQYAGILRTYKVEMTD